MAPKTKLQSIERPCGNPSCGRSFATKVNPDGTPAKGFRTTYCSRSCYMITRQGQLSAGAREGWEMNGKTCPCGEKIPYEKRHVRKYCSTECTQRYGKKRQSNPDLFITFNCERCGKEVTRRKTYGNGASRFCSNACSHRSNRTKIIALTDDDGELIQLDSSWEAAFYGMLTVVKIPVERVDRNNGIDLDGDGGFYAPDFRVGDNIYVEIKGLVTSRSHKRMDAWRISGKRGVILDEARMKEVLKLVLDTPSLAIAYLSDLCDMDHPASNGAR